MRRALSVVALVVAVLAVGVVGITPSSRRGHGARPVHRLRAHPTPRRPVNPAAAPGPSATHDHAVVARHSAAKAESRVADGVALIQLYAETHLHSGSSVEHAAAAHYGLTVDRFRAAHTQLLEQRARVRGGARAGTRESPTCSGLIPSLCPGRAGIHGGPGDWLESIAEECGEIFCSPMCMRNTWSCSVEFGDLETEADDPAYSKALCGQFFAEGCTEILGCCAKDEKMMDYVQDHQYQDRFPVPYLPTPSCEHDAKDGETEGKLCGKCNGAVEVELEALDCPFPAVDPDEDDAFLQVSAQTGAAATAAAAAAAEAHARDKAAVDAMSLDQLLREVKALRQELNLPMRELKPHAVIAGGGDHTQQQPSRHARGEEMADDAFPADAVAAATTDAAEDGAAGEQDVALVQIDGRIHGGARLTAGATTEAAEALTAAVSVGFRGRSGARGAEPWDAGPAKFKSLKYRCEKLKAVVEGAIGGMTAAFKAKACACMGCCSGECFFHVKERMTE